MRRSNQQLHIGEVVFKDVAAGGEGRIRDALEHEIAKLLRQQRTSIGTSSVGDDVHTGKLRVTPNADAEQVGANLAQHVQSALGSKK